MYTYYIYIYIYIYIIQRELRGIELVRTIIRPWPYPRGFFEILSLTKLHVVKYVLFHYDIISDITIEVL